MQPEKFSIRSRLISFTHAFRGIRNFVLYEHNARIHFTATIAVLIAALVFKVSCPEAATLAGVIGLVWVAEIVNTCFEKLADHITKQRHPEIKIIKDLAAGAVLVAAIIAVIAGLFIFIPKII
ncbi:diacylglycerol kinase family protein [Puia sp.]|jgi:diacylglycerol kinase (ATP)|uniref:diacylglycerol kinase family protein n=1 Tax=Puia sp. TaxID=2045100 RepID=UPI002F424F59